MRLLLECNNLNKEPQTQHRHTLTFPQEGSIVSGRKAASLKVHTYWQTKKVKKQPYSLGPG